MAAVTDIHILWQEGWRAEDVRLFWSLMYVAMPPLTQTYVVWFGFDRTDTSELDVADW